jgi:hypothetical protein
MLDDRVHDHGQVRLKVLADYRGGFMILIYGCGFFALCFFFFAFFLIQFVKAFGEQRLSVPVEHAVEVSQGYRRGAGLPTSERSSNASL